jgi:hypothetical protein
VRIPLLPRYAIALSLWLIIVSLDFAVRLVCVLFIPLIAIKSAFGLAHNQWSAQANVDLVGVFTRPFMRMPRYPWRQLVPRRLGGRSASSRATSSGEVLPPLHE